MRRSALLVAVSGALLACDARISPHDGRLGPPQPAAWLLRLKAPGRLEVTKRADSNGVVLRLDVLGPAGPYELLARVSGTNCAGPDGNAPVLEVRADGSELATWAIANGSLARYTTPLRLADRPRRVNFWFTNDWTTPECDRSITLHSIDVRRSAWSRAH
jgi:hypothetical protein